MLKYAEPQPQLAEWAAQNPDVALVPLSGAAGAASAHKTRRQPATDTLRGALTGLGTGLGIFGGARLGNSLGGGDGMLLGGGTGGLLSYLAMQKLLRGMQPDQPKRREKRSVAPIIQQLLQAKQLSDTRAYADKHKQLRAMIDKYPNDFVIDSEKNGIVGITHKPTKFKLHVPLRVVPTNMARIDDVQPTTQPQLDGRTERSMPLGESSGRAL